jgi:SAM-dependent methyltransferase
MNTDEYAKLDRLDRSHWFYRGKRAIVRTWVDRSLLLQPDDLLIDAGCGTGTWLVEMSHTCRVLGLDDYEESIALARPRLEAVGGGVLKTSLEKVDLPDGCAAVVTLLDVLEHLDDDRGALEEMIRLVRPGGLVVITVPALRWLWSDWDVSLHHRRRYTRPDLLRLTRHPEMEVLRCSYFNSALLLPIFLVRLWRKLCPPRPGQARAEDSIPPRWLNVLLEQSMVAPAQWRWFYPPLGVSLLAVLRRRQPQDRNLPVDRACARLQAG